MTRERACLRADGTTKASYSTRAQARRAARRARKLDPARGRLTVYSCTSCIWFHIGHSSPARAA